MSGEFGVFFGGFSVELGVKVFLVLFLVFYCVFALILYRQVQVMSQKLATTLSPILLFVGILNLGLSLAVLFLVLGSF